MKRILKMLAIRHVARVALCAALLGIAAIPSQLDAVALKSDSQVKVSARATKPDAAGKQIVTVTMDINEGWHIYGNPVKNEVLMEAQTQVKIDGINQEKVEVRYPNGKEKESSVTGKYVVYEGKVAIQAAVQRTPMDANGLEVSVRFMSCHDQSKKCLLPAEVKFKLP